VRMLALLFATLSISLAALPAWSADPRYEFKIGIWRNLHHLLYAQALSDPAAARARKIRLDPSDEAIFDVLTPAERNTWNAARAYYVGNIIGKNLLFDEELRAIGIALSETESSEQIAATGLPPDLRSVLRSTEAIYRKYWWPGHRARNQRWAREIQPFLSRHGAKLRARLEAVYGAAWPDEPVIVDLVFYANSAGAYTTLDPTRIAISTSDSANWNEAALEILLHETTHAMAQPLREQLEELVAAAVAKPDANVKALRRDLWHETLFYLTGEVLTEELPGYTPYADKNGLWTIAWPGRDRKSIEQAMAPYLDGLTSMHDALATLVSDLAESPVTAGRP
jgi:hypothetical protein